MAHVNIEDFPSLSVFPLFQETFFCMRYLKFRNILLLLEVQETDRRSYELK